MNPHFRALPAPGSLEQTLYPATSRYHGVPVAAITSDDGTEVAYLRRRFVPSPVRFVAIREHQVTEGDRLDRIAALYLGDPEQFWRICDANAAMKPDELTQIPGSRILITLPEGVTAPQTI